ncbi:hypothetical protein LIA77_09366 [Sarocladium implicatum]|nr:hypothetical protein LIA77_09366 [Sarocladium implicatum]
MPLVTDRPETGASIACAFHHLSIQRPPSAHPLRWSFPSPLTPSPPCQTLAFLSSSCRPSISDALGIVSNRGQPDGWDALLPSLPFPSTPSCLYGVQLA